jgi:hypothetical protein
LILDESRPKAFVDNDTQGLFEIAEPNRAKWASGSNDANQERRTTA